MALKDGMMVCSISRVSIHWHYGGTVAKHLIIWALEVIVNVIDFNVFVETRLGAPKIAYVLADHFVETFEKFIISNYYYYLPILYCV